MQNNESSTSPEPVKVLTRGLIDFPKELIVCKKALSRSAFFTFYETLDFCRFVLLIPLSFLFPIPCSIVNLFEFSTDSTKEDEAADTGDADIKEELKHHCSHFNKTSESTSTPANHDNDQKSRVTNDLV